MSELFKLLFVLAITSPIYMLYIYVVRIFDFKTRSGRLDVFALFMGGFCLAILNAILYENYLRDSPLLKEIFGYVTTTWYLVAATGVSVRRFHDFGFSEKVPLVIMGSAVILYNLNKFGWLPFGEVIMTNGGYGLLLFFLILFAIPGPRAPNQYGLSPLLTDEEVKEYEQQNVAQQELRSYQEAMAMREMQQQQQSQAQQNNNQR